MEILNTGRPQDLFDLVETISQLKVPKFRTEMEEALVKVLRQITSEEFAKTVVLLGGRQSEISYLTTLYTESQKPARSARGGFFLGKKL